MLGLKLNHVSKRGPWSSFGTLKLAFNVSSDDQGNHQDDIFVLVCACEVNLTNMGTLIAWISKE